MGDVFEGGTDLTVLPCGAKPTWTASVDRWIDRFGLPTPKQLAEGMQLSDVTPPVPFTGPKHITKYVSYGASVLNDQSTAEAIRKLGANIGKITKSNADIRRVESVLFGTGHGKLEDTPAAKALAAGFRETADPSATLWIWVHSSERHRVVERALESGLTQRIINSVNLSPGWMGIGINLKKLLGLEK
jgi:hypothetical protein